MLKIYTVVHHKGNHETTTKVIANSRLDASSIVGGEVMHVYRGEEIHHGSIISESGWNKSFLTPDYTQPSQEWKEYLKKQNMRPELEDVLNVC